MYTKSQALAGRDREPNRAYKECAGEKGVRSRDSREHTTQARTCRLGTIGPPQGAGYWNCLRLGWDGMDGMGWDGIGVQTSRIAVRVRVSRVYPLANAAKGDLSEVIYSLAFLSLSECVYRRILL